MLSKIFIRASVQYGAVRFQAPTLSATIGNVYVSPSSQGQARYHLYNGGATAEWIFGQKTSDNHNFIISKLVSGTETDYLTINTSGNIGIGTTNPLVALDVAGAIRQELHTPTMPVGLNDDIGKKWTIIELGQDIYQIRSLVYCGNGIVLAGGGSDNGDGDIYMSDVGFSQGGTSAAGVLNAIGSANQVLYKNASNVATTSPNLTFNGTTAISVNGVVNVGSGVTTGFYGDDTNLAVRVPKSGGGFYVQSPSAAANWAVFQSSGLTVYGALSVTGDITAFLFFWRKTKGKYKPNSKCTRKSF